MSIAPAAEHPVVDGTAVQLNVDDGTYGKYELAQIRKSPDNRKRFNEQALQELAASIKSMGVAQPILIRPVTPTEAAPEKFEIVAGERRYRASVIAGMGTIPAMCRTLSDLDAAKIRILENLQREDPHPMEEAEGYEQLMMKHGYSADQLAEEIKKSRAYVYGRLKLCALTSLVQQHFLDGMVSASTALLIARIAVPALQFQAYTEIARENNPNWGPMSHREAAAHIQQRYMLDLTQAPFQMSDAKLLATAGSCVKCPKRSGNQPEVFADLSADVCTDPDCFAEKRGAHTARLIVDANKNGIPVLEDDDQVEAFHKTGDFCEGRDYVYSVSIPRDSKHYYTGVADALGAKELPEPKAYIKDGQKLLPVFETSALKSALEKAGICESDTERAQRLARQAESPDSKKETERQAAYAAEQTSIETKAEQETQYRVALYKKLRSSGQTQGFSVQSLRELVKMMLRNMASLPDDLLADVYSFDTTSEESISAHMDKAELPEIQLLLVDLVVGDSLGVQHYQIRNGSFDDDGFAHIAAMCNAEGIDPVAVREELFPSPIDVTDMQYVDLVKFIMRAPGRINELKDIVIAHPRTELIQMLEDAAKTLGFNYAAGGFEKSSSSADAESIVTGDVDVDVVEAAPPGTPDEAAAATTEPQAIEPAPEVAAAKPAKAKAKGKAATPAPVKAAAKSKAPAKKADALAPAAAWPFPKPVAAR